MIDAFSSIRQGLSEAIEYSEGKFEKAIVHNLDPVDVKNIRAKVGMSQKNIIRDSSGRVLYRTMTHMGQTKVYDSRSKLLGWCANGQTRDSHGNLIAQSETPGLLYKQS